MVKETIKGDVQTDLILYDMPQVHKLAEGDIKTTAIWIDRGLSSTKLMPTRAYLFMFGK